MKSFVLCALGANAEIEALKKVVAEADKKAAAEQALREKHEARVIEAERELQEAVKKSETLEQSLAGKESELAQALQAANDAREEAQGALKDIQEARKIASGKAFSYSRHLLCSDRRNSRWQIEFLFLQGHLRGCHAAYLTLLNSIKMRRRRLRRSSSSRSIWRRIIRCHLSIS